MLTNIFTFLLPRPVIMAIVMFVAFVLSAIIVKANLPEGLGGLCSFGFLLCSFFIPAAMHGKIYKEKIVRKNALLFCVVFLSIVFGFAYFDALTKPNIVEAINGPEGRVFLIGFRIIYFFLVSVYAAISYGLMRFISGIYAKREVTAVAAPA